MAYSTRRPAGGSRTEKTSRVADRDSPTSASGATAVTPTRTTFQPFQLPSLPANLLGGRDGQGTVAPAQTQGQTSTTHQTQTSPQIRPGTANSALSSVNSPNLTSGANLAYPGHTPHVVQMNGSGFMSPGDTTPDLSFLDLHYFTPASSSLSSTLSSTGDLHCSNPSLSSSPPSQHQPQQQQQHHQHHSHQHHHQHLGHNTTPFYHPGGTNAKSDDLWGALGHSHGRAQALDLAQSLSLARAHVQANQHNNSNSNNKPLCIEPSSLMQFSSHSSQTTGSGNGNGNGTRSGSRALNIGQQMLSTLQTGACQTLSGNGVGVGMGRGHQRGQSATAALSLAVAPQDLMIRKGKGSDNNKRKRASWDGGAG